MNADWAQVLQASVAVALALASLAGLLYRQHDRLSRHEQRIESLEASFEAATADRDAIRSFMARMDERWDWIRRSLEDLAARRR